MTLEEIFMINTKHEFGLGWYRISCKHGTWSVCHETRQGAIHLAADWFTDKYLDGQYDSTITAANEPQVRMYN